MSKLFSEKYFDEFFSEKKYNMKNFILCDLATDIKFSQSFWTENLIIL